jgi:hypothetical protein
MNKNRIANLVIVAVLSCGLVLTARLALDTTRVVSAARTGAGGAAACAFSDWDLHTITAVYVPEIGGWFPRTDADFTGRDGGLLSLGDC